MPYQQNVIPFDITDAHISYSKSTKILSILQYKIRINSIVSIVSNFPPNIYDIIFKSQDHRKFYDEKWTLPSLKMHIQEIYSFVIGEIWRSETPNHSRKTPPPS